MGRNQLCPKAGKDVDEWDWGKYLSWGIQALTTPRHRTYHFLSPLPVPPPWRHNCLVDNVSPTGPRSLRKVLGEGSFLLPIPSSRSCPMGGSCLLSALSLVGV